jgi:hypothetical protein
MILSGITPVFSREEGELPELARSRSGFTGETGEEENDDEESVA